MTFKASYEAVRFNTADADELIDAARNWLGGERPQGTDMVYALTSKGIIDLGAATIGKGDCIGDVKYPDRAFAVGELRNRDVITLQSYLFSLPNGVIIRSRPDDEVPDRRN